MKTFTDVRGVFIKPFDAGVFSDSGLETAYKEDFYSVSKKGVLRGLHFQLPPEDHVKLVYCSRGAVLDVAVDLRVGSPGFRKTFSVELSESNGKAVYLPKGFAHGFLALTDHAAMHYKVSSLHSAAHDCGLLWSSIDFDWDHVLKGVIPDGAKPIVSERDGKFQKLTEFQSPFSFSMDKI